MCTSNMQTSTGALQYVPFLFDSILFVYQLKAHPHCSQGQLLLVQLVELVEPVQLVQKHHPRPLASRVVKLDRHEVVIIGKCEADR